MTVSSRVTSGTGVGDPIRRDPDAIVDPDDGKTIGIGLASGLPAATRRCNGATAATRAAATACAEAPGGADGGATRAATASGDRAPADRACTPGAASRPGRSGTIDGAVEGVRATLTFAPAPSPVPVEPTGRDVPSPLPSAGVDAVFGSLGDNVRPDAPFGPCGRCADASSPESRDVSRSISFRTTAIVRSDAVEWETRRVMWRTTSCKELRSKLRVRKVSFLVSFRSTRYTGRSGGRAADVTTVGAPTSAGAGAPAAASVRACGRAAASADAADRCSVAGGVRLAAAIGAFAAPCPVSAAPPLVPGAANGDNRSRIAAPPCVFACTNRCSAVVTAVRRTMPPSRTIAAAPACACVSVGAADPPLGSPAAPAPPMAARASPASLRATTGNSRPGRDGAARCSVSMRRSVDVASRNVSHIRSTSNSVCGEAPTAEADDGAAAVPAWAPAAEAAAFACAGAAPAGAPAASRPPAAAPAAPAEAERGPRRASPATGFGGCTVANTRVYSCSSGRTLRMCRSTCMLLDGGRIAPVAPSRCTIAARLFVAPTAQPYLPSRRPANAASVRRTDRSGPGGCAAAFFLRPAGVPADLGDVFGFVAARFRLSRFPPSTRSLRSTA